MSDLLSAHWAAAPANPPLPGAVHHWQLTPCCDTTGATDLLDLPHEVVDDLLAALRMLRDRHGWPGYSWAVQPGEVVVHVVAGGRATFEFKPVPTTVGSTQ